MHSVASSLEQLQIRTGSIVSPTLRSLNPTVNPPAGSTPMFITVAETSTDSPALTMLSGSERKSTTVRSGPRTET